MRHNVLLCLPYTVYPKKYAHGVCFAVLCCGYTLTDFPISIRLTSLALWQSNDCPSASKATLMNMDKYFKWIHYERLHNHNKAKHNKTVCIFLGIYCSTRVIPGSIAPLPFCANKQLSLTDKERRVLIHWPLGDEAIPLNRLFPNSYLDRYLEYFLGNGPRVNVTVTTVMSLLKAPCPKTSWRALLFRAIFGITGGAYSVFWHMTV